MRRRSLQQRYRVRRRVQQPLGGASDADERTPVRGRAQCGSSSPGLTGQEVQTDLGHGVRALLRPEIDQRDPLDRIAQPPRRECSRSPIQGLDRSATARRRRGLSFGVVHGPILTAQAVRRHPGDTKPDRAIPAMRRRHHTALTSSSSACSGRRTGIGRPTVESIRPVSVTSPALSHGGGTRSTSADGPTGISGTTR